MTDSTSIQFKLDVVELYGQYALAFSIDRDFRFKEIQSGPVPADECAFVVAADALTQDPGDVVEETDSDRKVASTASPLEEYCLFIEALQGS